MLDTQESEGSTAGCSSVSVVKWGKSNALPKHLMLDGAPRACSIEEEHGLAKDGTLGALGLPGDFPSFPFSSSLALQATICTAILSRT
jgi:hypothetical protein